MNTLVTHSVEKVWGRRALPAPFLNDGSDRIGEIWFAPPPALPELLVKYLFTSEKLSVQVHPNDSQAPTGSRGKEECWYILDADPGATLAIGLKEEVDAVTLRNSAQDGSIEDLLDYHPVSRGDFFYLPAGTIHAIGPGISLIEIQQNSDITYRLYDYGRPRELHLDEAIGVAHRTRYSDARHQIVPDSGEVALVNGPHFRLDRIDGAASDSLCDQYDDQFLLMPISGHYQAAGENVAAGSCALVTEIDSVTGKGTALIARPL